MVRLRFPLPQSLLETALDLYGRGRIRLVPVSWTGATWFVGTGGLKGKQDPADGATGIAGKLVSGLVKSNAEVRSPQSCRRQSLIFGSCTPVQVSRKRMI